MSQNASQAIAVARALEAVLRQDRGRLMAALTYRLHSLQLAEDALQEACLSAMQHWGRVGLPQSPQGWLIRVAFRKALDQLRSAGRSAQREEALQWVNDLLGEEEVQAIPDERLRLIFTCCHPALELKSRVALTLRTICGLSTGAVARLFLDTEPTMAQRLSRAKAKIAKAGIAYAVPEPDQWNERLQAVLTTIYLIFTTGYLQPITTTGSELCEEAIFLARLLLQLHPDEPEVEGVLALMLLTHARRNARVNAHGATVPPAHQDRRLWDNAQQRQGQQILEAALHRRQVGPFQLKAAISACQMADPTPDWPQILALYSLLLRMEPTPVVRLNHAVALAENGHIQAALDALAHVKDELVHFQPFHAAHAAVLVKAGQWAQAKVTYRQAIALAEQEGDRLMLQERFDNLNAMS